MKKILYIIFLNVFICISILVLIDFILAKKEYNIFIKNITKNYTKKENLESVLPKFNYSLKFKSFRKYYNENYETFMQFPRKIIHNDNEHKKKSILILGCSYAEGIYLPDNEKLANKLSKATSRNVYNLAIAGMGLATALWELREPKTYKIFGSDDIEYVIYVIIPYHIPRMWHNKYGAFTSPIYISYKQKNKTLVEEKLNFFLRQICRLKFLREHIAIEEGKKYNDTNTFDLLKDYLINIKDETKKHYPNSKFILVKHPSSKDVYINDKEIVRIYNTERWKELEDEGFIIYDVQKNIKEDLSEDKYMLPDKHPTAESWDIFVKNFIEDLNL